ncbi:MAG: hypothetical protein DRO87_13160 [Candidatus Thorarchaeota archaeon]|nr:MAG: hypothetical protein DRO87_13160 [Candidatus Thorarchaeota archaeon]
MAKFQNKHLKLRDNERVYFGDSDDVSLYYDGTDFLADAPIKGQLATENEHLVRYDQLLTTSGTLQSQISALEILDWQESVESRSATPPGSPATGQRFLIIPTATGAWAGHEDDIAEWNGSSWEFVSPTAGTALYVEDEELLYLYDGTQWEPMGMSMSHSDLQDLTNDDHTQYILVDGTRAFTGTVGGVTPTADSHLTTKQYVDTEIATLSGSMLTDHGALTGLGDDDHTQYILVDGTRSFTSTVGGVDPIASSDLTTKNYVDNEITTLSGVLDGKIITDHGQLTGLGDDDHTQYVPTDGSRGFTNTVSGVSPVQDYDLATKQYVDTQVGGGIKTGREALSLNDSSKSVTFTSAYADTNYTISVMMNNTVDANPAIYPTIISAKATTGFTVLFSGDIDSANYELEWIAVHD